MENQYVVFYRRASESAKYKDQDKVPVHSVIVSASSAAKAKAVAAKVNGRILTDATEWVAPESHPDVTAADASEFGGDPFALTLASDESDAAPSDEEIASAVAGLAPDPYAPEVTIEEKLSETDLAAEALCGDDADLSKESAPQATPDEDQSFRLKDSLDKVDLNADDVVIIELSLINATVSQEASEFLRETITAALSGFKVTGDAIITPLTPEQKRNARLGRSQEGIAYEDGYNAGFDAGQGAGRHIGFEDGHAKGYALAEAQYEDVGEVSGFEAARITLTVLALIFAIAAGVLFFSHNPQLTPYVYTRGLLAFAAVVAYLVGNLLPRA